MWGFNVSVDTHPTVAALGALRAALRQQWWGSAAKAADPVQAQLAIYPPPRPNQRYKRTYRLQRGWKTPLLFTGSSAQSQSYTFANPMRYTWYVQHPKGQAWMHVGRWRTADTILKEQEDRIRYTIVSGVDGVLRASGLL